MREHFCTEEETSLNEENGAEESANKASEVGN